MSGEHVLDEKTPSTVDSPPPTTTDASYGQILKSTSIIGGAQLINMVIGLVRTKLLASLLGPSGIGLLGIFQAISGLASTAAGLGIHTSGVRDIARFHGDANWVDVAKTITTLKRVSWFTGLAGMFLLMSFSSFISKASFGSYDYTWSIVLLGTTVLLSNITASQCAVIQGTRRIGDLARINVFGALFGTIIATAFYAWFGTAGIVPSLVAISLVSLIASTIYARKTHATSVYTSWNESWLQSREMIKFGLAIVASGVVGAVVTYLTRVMIIREYDLAAAGIFAAAFGLSGMFVQFVLGAMGADFYPRLTAMSGDHNRMKQLINEQTEIGLLLSFPGLLATLVFAPHALTILYTAEFAPAADMLMWFILGCFGRVISWPLSYSLLAKGQAGLYMVTEIITQLTHLGLIWIGLNAFGLVGAAAAFTALYLFYTAAMLMLTRQTIGFSWSANVLREIAWMTPTSIAIFLCVAFLPSSFALSIGAVTIAIAGNHCLIQLATRLGSHHRLANIIAKLPLIRSATSVRHG